MNDRLVLQTFRTPSGSNLKSVAYQDRCFPHLTGKGTHLQRQAGVTEADRPVRAEEESELILDGLHGGAPGEGG